MIKLITCESGDWEILMVDGKVVYEDHSIPNHIWLNLISKLTKKDVSKIEVSDEQMDEIH